MLFQGYYKQHEMTEEVMDGDGFFHTGDIGEFTKEGSLRVIDRKKNFFKLSQGKADGGGGCWGRGGLWGVLDGGFCAGQLSNTGERI